MYMRIPADVDVLVSVTPVYVHVDAYVYVALCSYACVHICTKTLSLNTTPLPGSVVGSFMEFVVQGGHGASDL